MLHAFLCFKDLVQICPSKKSQTSSGCNEEVLKDTQAPEACTEHCTAEKFAVNFSKYIYSFTTTLATAESSEVDLVAMDHSPSILITSLESKIQGGSTYKPAAEL